MTDLNILAQQFYADGFAILRQVYSPDEIASLEQQLEDFVHRMVPSLQPGQVYFEDTRLVLLKPFIASSLIQTISRKS
ncbi:MAG: hypothetical protein EXQ58_00495 [Acidobacteria bacterium]|nr:hypothetical protein [Acidobacteriota bacterium]